MKSIRVFLFESIAFRVICVVTGRFDGRTKLEYVCAVEAVHFAVGVEKVFKAGESGGSLLLVVESYEIFGVN